LFFNNKQKIFVFIPNVLALSKHKNSATKVDGQADYFASKAMKKKSKKVENVIGEQLLPSAPKGKDRWHKRWLVASSNNIAHPVLLFLISTKSRDLTRGFGL
jgi:hypothetical protein